MRNRDIRIGKGLFDLTVRAGLLHADIVADLVPDQRRALFHGLEHINDNRQLFVIDLNQIGSVAPKLFRLGDDDRDCLAGPAHLVSCQRFLAWSWDLILLKLAFTTTATRH